MPKIWYNKGLKVKFYLAACYGRHVEMQSYANQLVALGHSVTSRWIWGGHDLREDAPPEENKRLAQEDLLDIYQSGMLIYFADVPYNGLGGRHVEFGIAAARGIAIAIIGHRENVFHYLPAVELYPTWRDFIIKLVMDEQLTLA